MRAQIVPFSKRYAVDCCKWCDNEEAARLWEAAGWHVAPQQEQGNVKKTAPRGDF